MAIVEERIGDCFLRLTTEQLVKPKPTDILRFDVTVTISQYEITHQPVLRGSKVIKTEVPMRCETLFENNQNLILSFLCSPRYSRYFIAEILDQISHSIVYFIQQLLLLSPNPVSVDLESQEFPIALEIFKDVIEDQDSGEESEEEMENAVIEESMQQEVRMVPASNEAILSLKIFTDTLSLKTEDKCNICLEKFQVEKGDEDVKLLSSMPCNHIFHHQCIVKWLQTSHMCPLCRYPMPATKD